MKSAGFLLLRDEDFTVENALSRGEPLDIARAVSSRVSPGIPVVKPSLQDICHRFKATVGMRGEAGFLEGKGRMK